MAAITSATSGGGTARDDRAAIRARVDRQVGHLKRIVPLIALIAWAVHGRSGTVPASAHNAGDALARALAAEGLETTAEDVLFLDPPRGLRRTIAGDDRAIVRAKPTGEGQHDIYLVRTRRSPEGVVLSVGASYNLTRTAGVDETRPIAIGPFVAFATVASGSTTGFDIYDLEAEDPRQLDGWKDFARFQNAVTNLQRTGSVKGVQRRHYALEPAASSASLEWREGRLTMIADGQEIVVDPRVDDPIEGAARARFEKAVKAKPGDLITWSVDRVRAVSWLGPQFIELLEYNAFKARDTLKQKWPGVFAEDAAKEVVADLGGAKITPTYTDPEIGWPPAQITPLITPPLPNEGVWLGTDDDPFVGKNAGVPSAFVQTFVRTDRERPYARVYVTLWDPRQVALHMVAGTVEPVSATGEVGTGQIPRTPEVLNRVVAGFNGGFQAIHFEGGMQADGTTYLPPKPYAGTVAELRDGTTAIGTWPDGAPEIPDEILSFRQNLVPLVKDGEVNPYKQIKWGGTPPGSQDAIHTTRSGVCITRDGFVGYFFGNDMTPETLGRGMVAAGCRQGVHLDMNAGHTGFEFYRVAPSGELPDLMRPLQADWEAEGTVPRLPGWSFRARRMIKGMPHMLFPRYIGRDGRDFMYLTLRSVLPGPRLVPRVSPPDPEEGVWRTKGLPQHGFPYAIATTTLRPDPKRPEIRARILKVDPRMVRLEHATGGGSDRTVVSLSTPETPKGETRLWLATGSFAIGAGSPGPGAVPLVDGEPAKGEALAAATALVGVGDDDGTLVVALADAPAGPALRAVLQQLGCSQAMVAPKGLDLRLGDHLDLRGETAEPLAGTVVRLERAAAPAARELFPDTPVVEPAVWQPLQAKRVRYFRKAKPPKPGSTSPAAPPAGEPN
jgi:hypothetical protein